MINQFNKCLADANGFTTSVIASVFSGHFDTNPVNVWTREGKKQFNHRVTRIKKTDLLRETPCPPWLIKITI